MQELRSVFGSLSLISVGADVLVLRSGPDGQEVLLLHRSDGDYWSLPGGSLEPGESLEQAARRELFEETGLAVEKLELLTVCSGPGFEHQYPNGDRIHNVAAIYLFTEELRGEPLADGVEGRDVRYFPTEDLPTMPLVADVCSQKRCPELLFLVIPEDFEDFVYQGFAFVWGEVAGVDGLFIGLEVAAGGFFGQVLVYEADDGVHLLAGKSVAATGQSAPHAIVPLPDFERVRQIIPAKAAF